MQGLHGAYVFYHALSHPPSVRLGCGVIVVYDQVIVVYDWEL